MADWLVSQVAHLTSICAALLRGKDLRVLPQTSFAGDSSASELLAKVTATFATQIVELRRLRESSDVGGQIH